MQLKIVLVLGLICLVLDQIQGQDSILLQVKSKSLVASYGLQLNNRGLEGHIFAVGLQLPRKGVRYMEFEGRLLDISGESRPFYIDTVTAYTEDFEVGLTFKYGWAWPLGTRFDIEVSPLLTGFWEKSDYNHVDMNFDDSSSKRIGVGLGGEARLDFNIIPQCPYSHLCVRRYSGYTPKKPPGRIPMEMATHIPTGLFKSMQTG